MSHILRMLEERFGVVPAQTRADRRRRYLRALLGSAAAIGLLVIALSPWKALMLVVGILFLAVALAKPEVIILFLVAYTPFEPFLLKFVPDDIYLFARYFSEGLIYLLFFAVAVLVARRKRKLVSTPLDLPFVFLLIAAGTSLLINFVPPVAGILGIRQIIRFMLLFFLTVYLDPDSEFIKRVTMVMFAIVLFQGLLGITQSMTGGRLDEFLIPSERKFYESIQLTSGTQQFWSPGTRVFATMGRYDQLGTFLSFFLLLAVGLWYHEKDPGKRRELLLLVLLAAPGFIMTLSRASWFGFLLGFLVIAAWLRQDWRVRAAVAVCIATATAYVALSGLTVRYLTDYAGQTPVERLFEAFSYERWRGEYFGLGRLYWIVQTPTQVVTSSPLFGVGPGQYGGGAAAALGNSRAYEKLGLPFGVYGTEGYIDNNWFSVWGELGTLGLIFYAWMVMGLGWIAYDAWQTNRHPWVKGLALGYLGAVIAVSFQAFLGTYLEVRTLAMYLWLYGAFIFVLARRQHHFL
jgi:hypothetical protein